jgi:hypothetical protein
LKHFDIDFEHRGESCKDVVLQHYIRNGFIGSGQLICNVEQLSEIGVDRLSGNWTQLAEFPKECQAADSSACGVHSLCKNLPHSHRILNLVEIGLNRGTARSVDDGTRLCSSSGIIFMGLALPDGSIGVAIRILGFLLLFIHDLPGLDTVQDLFAVFLPGGIVRGVEESDTSQGMLEGFFVRIV